MMIVKFTSHFNTTFPMRITEWLLAAILMSWGVVMLQPEDIFTGRKYYEELAKFAPQHTWGVCCFLVGAVRGVALAINGAWRPTPHIRSGMSVVSCFFWLQISLGLIVSGITSTGLAVYPWLLLAEVYSAYRSARDAQASDERARKSKPA